MTLDVFKNYHATWIHARIISSKLRANISPCLVEWRKNSLSRATLRVYWAHTNLVAIFSANVVLAKFKESCLHLKRSWFSPCRLFKVDAGSSPCIHSTTLTSSLPDYSGELLCQVTCVEPLIFFSSCIASFLNLSGYWKLVFSCGWIWMLSPKWKKASMGVSNRRSYVQCHLRTPVVAVSSLRVSYLAKRKLLRCACIIDWLLM